MSVYVRAATAVYWLDELRRDRGDDDVQESLHPVDFEDRDFAAEMLEGYRCERGSMLARDFAETPEAVLVGDCIRALSACLVAP